METGSGPTPVNLLGWNSGKVRLKLVLDSSGLMLLMVWGVETCCPGLPSLGLSIDLTLKPLRV